MSAQKLSEHLGLIERALKELNGTKGGADRTSLGTAEPDSTAEPGWFRIRGRLTAWQVELLAEAQVQAGSGPQAISYDVLGVESRDDQARIRVSAAAPIQPMAVTVPSVSLKESLTGVTKILQENKENPILAQFIRATLTPVQADRRLATSVAGWPALRPSQQQAVAACCSSGLQLIWGPPGTGKTRVIAAAIAPLVEAKHRILLLSANNIAVDNALEQALQSPILKDLPGRALRVGSIHLASIANNCDVSLPQLVEARQRDARAHIEQLSAELAELAAAEQNLAGFEVKVYRGADQRVVRRQRQAAIALEQDALSARIAPMLVQVQRLLRDQLLVECEAARELGRQIAENLRQLDQAMATNARASPWARLRRLGRNRRLGAQRSELLAEQASAGQAQRAADQAAAAAGLDPLLAQAPNPDRIREELAAAQARLDSANGQLQALGLESDDLIRSGLGTAADQALVHAQLGQWRQYCAIQGRDLAAEQAVLAANIAALEKELSQEKSKIQQEIIDGAQLVATTLSQISLRPALRKKPYDFVIIDEAATASIPFLLAAVSLATRGAVVVGDYLQNSPIVDKKFKADAELKAYFERDCFSYLGATDPSVTRSRAGCVVLTEQFRFGTAITELANRVAYRGVLSCAGHTAGEVVLVTVDELPWELWQIRKPQGTSKWWVIGTLLARALAENNSEGDFGVITPYTEQARATEEALDDSAGSRGTAVGTAHSFQGREFATVLADLVEDGRGWVAGARLSANPGQLSGIRVFNVAVTRAQHRLYILTTQGSLDRAKAGPLAELKRLSAQGVVRCVSAADLLGLTQSAPDYAPDSAEGELISALQQYVRVNSIADEDSAILEVIDRINRAVKSIWCWSAWVGKNAADIADALVRAQERGVRVQVMARPTRQVQGSNQESLARLAERLPSIKYIHDMHQKIVIVDEQWCVFGSQNVLSHGKNSSARIRDVMVVLDSASFARRLLHFEFAEELGQARSCPQCGTALRECGLRGSGAARGWYWLCDRGTQADPHWLAFTRSAGPQRNG